MVLNDPGKIRLFIPQDLLVSPVVSRCVAVPGRKHLKSEPFRMSHAETENLLSLTPWRGSSDRRERI
jgi:hypothetical protein